MKTLISSFYPSRRLFSLFIAALLLTTPILLGGCDSVDPGLETETESPTVLARTDADKQAEDDFEEDAPTFMVTEMEDRQLEEGETTRVEGYVGDDADRDERKPEPGDIYFLETGDEDLYNYNAEVLNVFSSQDIGKAEYELRVEITEIFYEVPDFYPSER